MQDSGEPSIATRDIGDEQKNQTSKLDGGLEEDIDTLFKTTEKNENKTIDHDPAQEDVNMILLKQ